MKYYIYNNKKSMKNKRESVHCEWVLFESIPFFFSLSYLSIVVTLLFHRDAIDPFYYCLFLSFFPYIPQALLKLFLLRFLLALPSSFSVLQLRLCFVRIFPSKFFFFLPLFLLPSPCYWIIRYFNQKKVS